MSTTGTAVSFYDMVGSITEQMLAAARKHDWDRLAQLEDYCAEYIDMIRIEQPRQPLNDQQLAAKVASLKKILADDREIRHHVEPWMNRLEMVLGGKSPANSKDERTGS